MNDLQEAQLLARRHGLLVLAKRTGAGAVQEYRVFRQLGGGVAFLGSRVNAAGTLKLVRDITKVAA